MEYLPFAIMIGFVVLVIMEGYFGWKTNNGVIQFIRPTVYKSRETYECSPSKILNLKYVNLNRYVLK